MTDEVHVLVSIPLRVQSNHRRSASLADIADVTLLSFSRPIMSYLCSKLALRACIVQQLTHFPFLESGPGIRTVTTMLLRQMTLEV